MRAVLDYCTGGTRREAPAGTLVLHEGSKTGHLFVLLEGRLEVIKGDAVVAVLTEPGAMLGEMSVLLDQPHTATVRAASDFGDLRVRRCRGVPARAAGGVIVDRTVAGAAPQCCDDLSCRPHASICRSRQSSLDGRRTPAEHDQPAAVAGLARLGSAIRLQALEALVLSALLDRSPTRSPSGWLEKGGFAKPGFRITAWQMPVPEQLLRFFDFG